MSLYNLNEGAVNYLSNQYKLPSDSVETIINGLYDYTKAIYHVVDNTSPQVLRVNDIVHHAMTRLGIVTELLPSQVTLLKEPEPLHIGTVIHYIRTDWISLLQQESRISQQRGRRRFIF